MAYNKFLVLASALFLISCGEKADVLPLDKELDKKSTAAQESCSEISLFQDFAFDGDYLFHAVRCASNQTDSSEESLGHVLKLVNQLSPQGIQSFVDFALLPSPGASNTEETYPFLSIMNVLIERGARTEDGQLSLAEERFDVLQPFLMNFNVNRSLNLVKQWHQAGQLQPILVTMGEFLNAVNDGSFSVLSRELIHGTTVKPHLMPVALELLGKRALMLSVENLMTPEETLALDAKSSDSVLSPCFETWGESRPVNDKQSCEFDISQAELKSKSGMDRYQEFRDSVGEQQIMGLIEMVFGLLESYQDLSSEQRLHTNQVITSTIESLLDSQANPSMFGLALIRELQTASAADLSLVSSKAEELLEPKYEKPLNKLRSKMGTAKLIDFAGDLLLNGGALQPCKGLKLEGIKTLTTKSSSEDSIKILQSYLVPNEKCGYMPPLAAAMARELGSELSFDCSNSSSDLRCIQVPMEAYGKVTKAHWNLNESENLALNKSFLINAMDEAIAQLKLDPHYLWNLNLSKNKVTDLSPLYKLRSRIAGEESGLSAQQIATLDQELNQSTTLLNKDFLERLLALRVKKIAAAAEEFNGLIPEADNMSGDNKAARVFAGLYTDGPMIRKFQEHFTNDRILEEITVDSVKESLAQSPDRLSQFLFRMKRADSIFKNPSRNTDSYGKQQSNVIGANVLNYVSFDELGEFTLKDRDIVSPKQLFAEKSYLTQDLSTDWSLWSKHLYSGGLTIKDIPMAIGKKGSMGASDFEVWTAGQAMPAWQTEDYWKQAMETAPSLPSTLDPSFLTSETYSLSESRLIALYYMNNYLRAPVLIPENASFEGSERFSATGPWLAFTNLSFLSNPRNQQFPWKVYYNSFPKLFSKRYDSFENLQDVLLPQFEDVAEGELFSRRFTYSRNRSMENFASSKFPSDTLRVYSSLNLLTFTGSLRTASAQPAVAIAAKYCYDNSNSSTPNRRCPIELSPDKEPADAYQDLQRYVANTLALKLCPLLKNDQVWQERLGLSLSSREACSLSALKTLDLSENAFPEWYGFTVLDDIFKMGKNPRLHPDLAKLHTRIRWEKTKDESPLDGINHKLLLSGNFSPVDQESAALDWYQQGYALNMWQSNIGLVASYTGFLQQLMSHEVYTELSRDYGLVHNGVRNDSLLGILKAFVNSQKQIAAEDGSALEVLLRTVRLIGQDEALSIGLAHMLNHHSSPISYEFLSTEMPSAVQGLFGFDFDWSDKGLKLTRFVLNRDLIFAATHALRDFSSLEIASALSSLTESLSALGTEAQQEKTLSAALDLSLDLAVGYQKESQQFNGEQLEETLQLWKRTSFSKLFVSELNKAFDMSGAPLVSLQGRFNLGMMESLSQISQALSVYLPELVELHARSSDYAENDSGFWSALGLDLLRPLSQNNSGSSALLGLIADERLGFSNGLLADALKDELHCQTISAALGTVANLEKDDWRLAMNQSTDLLPRFAPLLGLANDKAVFEGKGSRELEETLNTIYDLSQNKHGLLDRQEELIDIWLTKELQLY